MNSLFLKRCRAAGLLLLVWGMAVESQAQQTKEVTTTVKDVTVFLQHAQVFSTASTNIGAGETELALINVPANLNESSIQVEAQGNATLLSIRYENNYLGSQNKPKDVLALEDSLQNYQNQLRTLREQNEVYQKEEALMLANQSIGGQKGVDALDLEEVADLFRKRLFAIKGNIQANDAMEKTNQW